MKGDSIARNLICIDNTSHLDRDVNGTPYLSFFRFAKPDVPVLPLIAYADQNGDPKCEEFSSATMQSLQISKTGDFKAICKCGLQELAKRRFQTYEEYNKKYDMHLPTDGRGLIPMAQDSSTIIFCSDFFGITPSFFNMARVGPSCAEFYLRPIDDIICLYVEDRHTVNPLSFPPWLRFIALPNTNPYSLGLLKFQKQYQFFSKKETHAFHFNLRFPTGEVAHFSTPLTNDIVSWPFPYDVVVKDLKSRPNIIPTYKLVPSEKITSFIDVNQYRLSYSTDLQDLAVGYFTLHTDTNEPPFGIVDFTMGVLSLSAWNFPFFNTTPNNSQIIQYMKDIPLAYLIPAQVILGKRGYDVNRTDLNRKYTDYLAERGDFYTAPPKEEKPTSEIPFDRRISSNTARFAMKDTGKITFQPLDTYKCIENYDTADNESWTSLNTLVIQKYELNFQWKVDAPISIDRIHELMPHESQQAASLLTDESSDNPDEPKQISEQKMTVDSVYPKLDQLVVLLRERDVDSIKKRLENMCSESIEQYNIAKFFLKRAIDRFQLRGFIDSSYFDNLQ